MLTEKTLKLLEFELILERLAGYAASGEAADMIREEKPSGDPDTVAKTKEAVQAIISRINDGYTRGDTRRHFPSIGFLFPKLTVEGTVLETDEACAIGLFAERGEDLRKWLLPEPFFAETLISMPDCKEIAAAVFRITDREGNIRDLPELRAIKQRIRNLSAALETAVSRYVTDEDTRRMLQSTVPTRRDGRTVLAVKANFRGRIRGIVHDVSSGGQTVFIEPEDVVEKNNQILVEERALAAEIKRIMLNLTKKIAEHRGELVTFHATVLKLEVLTAKARYSLEEGSREWGVGSRGCCSDNGGASELRPPSSSQSPVFSPWSPVPSPQSLASSPHSPLPTPHSLSLLQARHPLLKNPVPIDLAMASHTRALIVTGPNTGGKTVALKTVGIFALMNQIGLALPCAEGTVLPVFDGVYADIGDEQSIGQSLSTFSAHITNIADIVSRSGPRSLVLLDELGSGTDPQEGGAIAMAVLDCLIEKNATVIVTTHHGILKNYGYARREAENASVEFDSKTLSPTYRIITGIPGESRALEIALRNGLPEDIVTRAGNYIDNGYADVSALISGLKEKHRELADLSEKTRLEDQRVKNERRKSDLKELRLRQKEAELKAGFAGKLRLLLDESRKTLENLIRELREGELTREKTLAVKEFLGELSRTVEAEDSALEEEERAVAEERRRIETAGKEAGPPSGVPVDFSPGMEVFAGEGRRRGKIIRLDKKSSAARKAGAAVNTWIVEIGSLKMSFPESDLYPAPQSRLKPHIAAVDLAPASAALPELNLRGLRLNEALDVMRRQTDAALLSGLKSFSVIHGTGDGVLQRAVHGWLKEESSVADYYFSRPEMGGFGRTEVILK